MQEKLNKHIAIDNLVREQFGDVDGIYYDSLEVKVSGEKHKIDTSNINSELAKIAKAEQADVIKKAKQETINKIIVTTKAGKAFDGDKASQDAIARNLAVMSEGDTTEWIMANNKPNDPAVTVTYEELKEALKLATTEVTKIKTSTPT